MDNLETTTAWLEKASSFIKDNVTATFKPVAYYDEELDCVRVITRDCSISEVRVNEYLTIAEDNLPPRASDRYVGFTVKGVGHFIRSKRKDEDRESVEIREVLEQMLTELPQQMDDHTAKTFVELAVNISLTLLNKVEQTVPLKLKMAA